MDSDDFYSNPANLFNSLPAHLPRPAGILTVAEGKEKVEANRRTLFEAWDKLHTIVLVHELTIRKRWAKRTATKRKELLLEVQPDLPKEHAPDVDAMLKNTPNLKEKWDTFLLPYLNVEDLTWSNGVKFLSLLHYRARYFPSAFASFDSNTLHFGIVSQAVSRYYVPDVSMLAFGDKDTYAKTIGWEEYIGEEDDAPSGFELDQVLGDALPLADGLPVLESQIKLLDFLLRVVSKILIDVDLNNLPPPSMDSKELSPPEIPLTQSSFDWMSSARTNSLRPYLEPFCYSLSEIESLVDTGYQLTLDHLIDLRTDPAFLCEELNLYMDHRLEALGRPPAPINLIQNRAVRFLLLDVYQDLILFHLAKTVLQKMKDSKYDYSKPHPRGVHLTDEYREPLQELRAIFETFKGVAQMNFAKILASSPGLRKFWNIHFLDSNYGKNRMEYRPVPGDRLMSILGILVDKQQTHYWHISKVFDEIDRLDRTTEHSRISPLLARYLSRLGIANDLLQYLDAHRPNIMAEPPNERMKKWSKLLGDMIKNSNVDMKLNHVAFPSSKFRYPKGPKNTQWAQGCQRVDQEFALFWHATNNEIKRLFGQEVFELTHGLLAPHLGRQTDWASLITPRSSAPQRKLPPTTYHPFSGIEQQSSSEKDVEKNIPPKGKVKRREIPGDRPAERHLGSSNSEPQTVSKPEPPPEQITVTAKSLKMFSMLFRLSESEELATQSGMIAWKEVLAGFAQIGFSVVKTRGSAWRFCHEDGRTINVHEPHPDSHLSFWQARNLGRRLTRNFGWTGSTFRLNVSTS
ncbi:hypothetical protein M422DRAFT_64888 [Sphaerobolus stellatus SS14]|nr:hypothetical protein M422DRAFT_64888 [Sphaerobolus stellatus SS14]